MATEIENPLYKSDHITLTATGGVINFDTDNANTRWEVTSVVTSTNQNASATLIPIATVALNTVTANLLSQGNNRGQSWDGNLETFQGLVNVGPCDNLAIIFTPPAGESGTPLVGVIASAVVTGRKYLRRG